MKKLLTSILLLPLFCCGQIVTDTLYFGTAANWTRVVSFRNSATSSIATYTRVTDSLNVIRTSLSTKLNSNGDGSQLTGITQSQVSGLTSAIAAKQDALVSNTNIKTINGSSVLGSGDLVVNGTGLGYTLDVQALTSSPTDGQTIYFGQLPRAPATVAATSKVYIRKAGILKIANIYCYSGTAGTNEAWVMSIRLNNTTDTQIASVSLGASERVFSNTSLSIAVAIGDYIEIKCVNPTWSVNPLTTIFGGYIYIE